MFHVKHYSLISTFYKANKSFKIDQIDINSLIDLIFSDNKGKFIYYDDILYGTIIDQLNVEWEDDKILIIAPINSYSNYAPSGFNNYNKHSIQYFSSIYSSLKKDIKAILCAKSQKNTKINNNYKFFKIDKTSKYDECLDFFTQYYKENDLITGINQFAKRGGILDVYPQISKSPKRISFLKESVEIKEFDIDSQLSQKIIKEIKIPYSTKNESLDQAIQINDIGFDKIILNKEKSIVINENINNKKVVFPFKKLTYPDYKKIEEKTNNIIYEDVNRDSGFININGEIIIPTWFKNKKTNNINKKKIDISEINVGDYVVHRDCGIGEFLGLKYNKGSNGSLDQELIIIKYLDNSIVTVDINHLKNVTFYASKEHDVQLDSLTNQNSWKKRKKSAIKNIQDIVNNLVKMYIGRKNAIRSSVEHDEIEDMFIQAFDYMETDDQNKCWEDIKGDLNNNVPMDRLICGDVGFGKTELAIRTAFRYILNNKKVLVLSPTTILSEQLYLSFQNRMKEYGVSLSGISRFKSTSEIKKIKDLWINNKIDIIVGTHAILYDNIYLESADLLIIDEEHRFGVKQKEKIKNIKPIIDILTMSATPIPRTLNMALSGMKKISTLSTPPKYRKPIITNISYYNEELIINVINNEIYRKGQVYFVHNNVDSLEVIVDFLRRKLDYLNIQFVHGQMNPKKIESTMKKFTNNEIHVLVCTSIIENGIDIPNVNTIIINNAHLFGLSQLYQIRGRVGRSGKQAYSYLMLPKKIKLNPDAYSRLKSIEKYTNLGSGYKIANMDLNIRGSGTIFGYNQSGNIENIGYELISKLIDEYIHANEFNINAVNINLINKGIIPNYYINSENIRLTIYRKIKMSYSLEELKLLEQEVNDRFGPIPEEMLRILEIQKNLILCTQLFINMIEEKNNIITIQFIRKSWEQKVTYLLNKINELIKEYEINYEVKEFKESLIIKLKKHENIDSCILTNKILNKLI